MRALIRGEVAVIDRVAPWDLSIIEAGGRDLGKQIALEKYALPTVHVLLPNVKRPNMTNRTLRRALLYGINRAGILEQAVLAGKPRPGFAVLSGPFPLGAAADDPIGFGSDRKIKPFPYEPRLALALTALALKELEADEIRARKRPALRPKPIRRKKKAKSPSCRRCPHFVWPIRPIRWLAWPARRSVSSGRSWASPSRCTK